MLKSKTYELLGIFIYTDTATTTFIDRRTENQRLKPPVLSGEHVTPQHTVPQQLSRHQTRTAITSTRRVHHIYQNFTN